MCGMILEDYFLFVYLRRWIKEVSSEAWYMLAFLRAQLIIPREDWSMLLMRGKTSVDLMKRDLHKCSWYGYIFTISFLSNSHYLAIFSLFLGSTRNQTTIRTCGNRNSHPKEEFSINEYSGQCHWQVYTLDLGLSSGCLSGHDFSNWTGCVRSDHYACPMHLRECRQYVGYSYSFAL